MTCHDATLSLGAYVVGALDPRERADVEAHLSHCPMCRDELAMLAPLPGLMSRLTIEEAVSGPPPVDDAMLERLLSAASRDRKVATHRRWMAVAAAAAVIAGGTAGGIAIHHSMNAPHWQQVSATGASGVHMSVDVEPGASGTALQLSLRGVPSGERCRLVAIADDGSRDIAGSWEATYSGTATIRSITSIPRNHLRQLVIETYDGQRLVSANVPAQT